MKRILYPCLIFFILLTIGHAASAQKCSGPIPIVSVYYPQMKGTKYGVGFEAGNLGGDSPLGLFAGFNISKINKSFAKADSAFDFEFASSFYLKGTFRLTRIENAVSLYAIASPQLSLEKGLEFQPGFRVVFPVGQKLALGIEPMWSFRQKSTMVNFHISF